jgi:hypothetical protein
VNSWGTKQQVSPEANTMGVACWDLTMNSWRKKVHKMNIFLKASNNKKVLSVHAPIVFTIFCFFVDESFSLLL